MACGVHHRCLQPGTEGGLGLKPEARSIAIEMCPLAGQRITQAAHYSGCEDRHGN